jgi:hypothetical protein
MFYQDFTMQLWSFLVPMGILSLQWAYKKWENYLIDKVRKQ